MAKSGEGKRPSKENLKNNSIPKSDETIDRRIRSLNGQIGVFNNSIRNTTAYVETLQNQRSTLEADIQRSQIEKEACLDKMCHDYEEDELHFREKVRSLEVRVDKSLKILDELVDRRFQSRNFRMQQIKELEESIVETRLNIDKIKLEGKHTLGRIHKLIDDKLIHYLSE